MLNASSSTISGCLGARGTVGPLIVCVRLVTAVPLRKRGVCVCVCAQFPPRCKITIACVSTVTDLDIGVVQSQDLNCTL